MPATRPTTTPSITHAQIAAANDEWGCNCGPAALAAATSLSLEEIRPHLASFAKKRFMQRDDMKAALNSLQIRWHENKSLASSLRWGVHRVQFHGPWMLPNVPFGARYSRSHWIAANRRGDERWVFDANHPDGWCPFEEWLRDILPQLVASHKKADGNFSFTCGLEFLEDKLS